MLNTVNTVDLESALGALDIKDLGEGVYEISSPNEKSIVLEVLSIDLALKTMTIRHQHSVHDIVLKDNLDLVLDKMGIKRSVDTVSTDIKAPMPGKVIDIIVAEGDTVVKGDGILILEAMKIGDGCKVLNKCTVFTFLSSAINQDGRSSSLTAPSGLAQQAVIKLALQAGSIHPKDIHTLQMHGTGTSLGDPIEYSTMSHFFAAENTTF